MLLSSLSLSIIVIVIIKPALQVKYQHAEQDGKVEERPQISNTSTPMAALSRLRHRLEVVVSQVKETSRESYCGCAGAKGRRTDGCADLKELVSHEHRCAHRQTGSSGSDNTTLNHKRVTCQYLSGVITGVPTNEDLHCVRGGEDRRRHPAHFLQVC